MSIQVNHSNLVTEVMRIGSPHRKNNETQFLINPLLKNKIKKLNQF
jgi:hypothetical protein